MPPPGRVFNRLVRPALLSDAAARAWLIHNVEEVGMFEHILPPLYDECADESSPEWPEVRIHSHSLT